MVMMIGRQQQRLCIVNGMRTYSISISITLIIQPLRERRHIQPLHLLSHAPPPSPACASAGTTISPNVMYLQSRHHH